MFPPWMTSLSVWEESTARPHSAQSIRYSCCTRGEDVEE